MIEVRDLNVTYAGADGPALTDVRIKAEPGEMVLVTGPTGCGKSTLLNCLNGVLLHESNAHVSGDVLLFGRDISGIPLGELCRRVGVVFQNPDSQVCAATPEAEVAFGLENLAIERQEMRLRIAEALDATGLAALRHRPTRTLSGGQKQRLVIACALAMRPDVLLLDEPISQLDPCGAREILNVIRDLKARRALTVVMIEHRLGEAVSLADRVVLMDQGRIVSDQGRDAAMHDLAPMRRMGLSLPQLPDLFERLGRPERPLCAEDAPLLEVRRSPAPPASAPSPATLCCLDGVESRYGRAMPLVFQDLTLHLSRGERVALMGSNGAGKSTLLALLAGLLRPTKGTIRWTADPAPAVGLVLQSCDLMLFCETVYDETAFAPRQAGRSEGEVSEIVADVLARMHLADLALRPPFALSRGQRLRTAVASVLSQMPMVLLLDEPTTGQDRDQIERLMTSLEDAFDLVVFCTHDVDTAASHATRVILLDQGRVIRDGPPEESLFDDASMERASVLPTSVQAYSRRLGEPTLTVDSLWAMLK